MRLCIDPVHLNKALKRSHYPLPEIEDVLPELAHVKVFSKADLKDGFLYIELDKVIFADHLSDTMGTLLLETDAVWDLTRPRAVSAEA